jgi:hypothetical protein
MAKRFTSLEPEHRAFIAKQHLFFVASAGRASRVNLSPKGLDGLRVLDDRTAVYLDRTGSGNETAAHLLADGRLTLMFCAFAGPPLILRLYGRGRILPRGAPEYAEILQARYAGEEPAGARHMVILDIELVQTSCGYGVPHYVYKGERPSLTHWAEAKTPEELRAYRREKNSLSLDGLPTGLVEDAEPDPLPEA